jgi:hypothetical protein
VFFQLVTRERIKVIGAEESFGGFREVFVIVGQRVGTFRFAVVACD